MIAASVALGAGELSTAQHVIDAAVTGGQGGRWARRRLLLWQAFVALQGERPSAARASLEEAMALPTPVSPRDELLRQTILVTLARRYQDLAALEAAWSEAHEGVRHIDVDLYTLLPLSALVCAAARVGDATTLSSHFTQGLELLGRLGSPPLWSLQLRWAAIQQGILLDSLSLGPHAKRAGGGASSNKLGARDGSRRTGLGGRDGRQGGARRRGGGGQGPVHHRAGLGRGAPRRPWRGAGDGSPRLRPLARRARASFTRPTGRLGAAAPAARPQARRRAPADGFLSDRELEWHCW